MTRCWWRLVIVGLALVAMGAACSDGGGERAGRLLVDGVAQVVSPDGEAKEVTGRASVDFGQRIELVEGTGVVELDGRRRLELRAGSNVVLDRADGADGADDGDRTVVVPAVLDGDVLVGASAEDPLTVAAQGATAVVSGDAQVSVGSGLEVSSYDGRVELGLAGESLSVSGLRSASLDPAGALAVSPSPIVYDVSDSWDRRFLGEAIDLGKELEARSRGFTAQVSTPERTTVEFMFEILPGLSTDPTFDEELFDPERPLGESLVGAAISLEGEALEGEALEGEALEGEALEGEAGTLDQRWASVFVFRDEGAQWGLVALDQGVSRAPVLMRIDDAIGRGPMVFDDVPDEPDPGGEIALPTTGSFDPGGGPTPTTVPSTPRATPTTGDAGSEPPPDDGRTGPVNIGIPLVDDTLNALIETLSGLLRLLGSS